MTNRPSRNTLPARNFAPVCPCENRPPSPCFFGGSSLCVGFSALGWGGDTPGEVRAAAGHRWRVFHPGIRWAFCTKCFPRSPCERGAGIRAGVKIAASPFHSVRQCRPRKGSPGFCAIYHWASKLDINHAKSVTDQESLRAASTIQGVKPACAPFEPA